MSGYGQGGYGQGGFPSQGNAPQQPNPPQQPSTPQPGYPQQQGGSPQAGFPQAGFPQGGYPQQGGGYPEQGGGYRQQGSGGYPPQGGYPGGPAGYGGGPGGQPPKKKSNALILGIVGAAVLLLVAIGAVAIVLHKPHDTAGPALPETTSPPPKPPSQAPSTDASPTAGRTTSDPSGSPTSSGGGQTEDAGNGLSFTIPAGYDVVDAGDDYVMVSDGEHFITVNTGSVDKGTDPKDVLNGWLDNIGKKLTNAKVKRASTADCNSTTVSCAQAAMSGTYASSSGSADIQLAAVASVRKKDGLTFLVSVQADQGTDATQAGKDFTAVVNSLLASQGA